MIIAIGCDHGGYQRKEEAKKHLKSLGHEVIDCGTNSLDSCDYPIFGRQVAEFTSIVKFAFSVVLFFNDFLLFICSFSVFF